MPTIDMSTCPCCIKCGCTDVIGSERYGCTQFVNHITITVSGCAGSCSGWNGTYSLNYYGSCGWYGYGGTTNVQANLAGLSLADNFESGTAGCAYLFSWDWSCCTAGTYSIADGTLAGVSSVGGDCGTCDISGLSVSVSNPACADHCQSCCNGADLWSLNPLTLTITNVSGCDCLAGTYTIDNGGTLDDSTSPLWQSDSGVSLCDGDVVFYANCDGNGNWIIFGTADEYHACFVVSAASNASSCPPINITATSVPVVLTGYPTPGCCSGTINISLTSPAGMMAPVKTTAVKTTASRKITTPKPCGCRKKKAK
jgi:hypothetical protein